MGWSTLGPCPLAWQWLAVAQHELLLFAAIWFAVFAIDEMLVDLVWFRLRLTGNVRTRRLCAPALGAPPDPDELLYDEALAAADSGELARARAMLEALVRRQPLHAGAWIDLALLDCRLGDRERGRGILQRIVLEFDPPTAIRELIARIANQPCGAATLPRWRAGLSVGRDSNVNLGSYLDRTTLVSDAGVVEVLLAVGRRKPFVGHGSG
ncbi:MAG: hypothetical protein B7Y31_08390, partial [Novosphingobium sp. 16-62-11]